MAELEYMYFDLSLLRATGTSNGRLRALNNDVTPWFFRLTLALDLASSDGE